MRPREKCFSSFLFLCESLSISSCISLSLEPLLIPYPINPLWNSHHWIPLSFSSSLNPFFITLPLCLSFTSLFDSTFIMTLFYSPSPLSLFCFSFLPFPLSFLNSLSLGFPLLSFSFNFSLLLVRFYFYSTSLESSFHSSIPL